MNWNRSTMNPTDWQYAHQRQRESLDPRPMTDSKEKIYYPYCGFSVNDRRLHAEIKHHNPSSHRPYRLNSNNFSPEMATDLDGDPVELSTEDKELGRKRRELQQIEDKISLKKATIAMKRTEPFLNAKTPCQMFKEEREEDLSHSKVDSSVRNTQPFMSTGEKDIGFSNHNRSSAYNNRPLKERVNVILQRRWPDGVLAKAFSTPSDHLPSPNPVEMTNMLTLNKEDHPLKLRVKALMNRRRNSGESDSHGEVPDVKPHPPSQSPSAPVDENDMVVKGFQRFISLLNKGVDIDMLTKIVNDDEEPPPTGQEILNSQPSVSEPKADVCKSESQQLQTGAGQRDRQSCSEERKTEALNQEISHGGSKINVQHEVKSTRTKDGGGRRKSRSPSVDEKKPKLEQHQGQLQYILNTIGLSLEANDLCKLSERTQERLHGLKDDTGTGVSERRRQHLRRHHSPSSLSTSMSKDKDKDRSDSPCSIPPRHQHSSSKTPRDSREQKQSSRYRHSRKRSKERVRERRRDCDKRSKERVRERKRDCDRDNTRIDSRGRSRDQRLPPENPEYHVPCPDTASAIPTYNSDALPTYRYTTSVQHSAYTAYHSHYSNGASSTAGNYGTNVIPPSSSSYPPGYFHYSANPLCPSANPGALLGQVHPYPRLPAGRNNDTCYFNPFYFNSDLSQSEGQTGQQSVSYLQVVNTARFNDIDDRCLLQLTNGRKSGNPQKKALANKRRLVKRKEERKVAKIQARAGCSSANNQSDPGQMQTSDTSSGITAKTLHPEPPPVEASTEVQQLERALPTEDEIKANLKKKLAAFNEKMKHQVPKPTETQPNVNDW